MQQLARSGGSARWIAGHFEAAAAREERRTGGAGWRSWINRSLNKNMEMMICEDKSVGKDVDGEHKEICRVKRRGRERRQVAIFNSNGNLHAKRPSACAVTARDLKCCGGGVPGERELSALRGEEEEGG